jgi:hypothetical protein
MMMLTAGIERRGAYAAPGASSRCRARAAADAVAETRNLRAMPVEERAALRGEMSAVVPVHPVVERVVEAQPAVMSARAGLDVDCLDRGLVPRGPTCAGRAVTEIQILHVHPVALVEQPDLVEHRAPQEHERAVDGVHGTLPDVGRAVRGERRRCTIEAADAEEMTECGSGCRKRAAGGVIEGAVFLHEPAAGDPDARVVGHQAEQRVEGSFSEHRVGVEDEDVVRLRLAQGEIVGPAEAHVLRQFDQPDLGEFVDDARRPVARRVVDDGDP